MHLRAATATQNLDSSLRGIAKVTMRHPSDCFELVIAKLGGDTDGENEELGRLHYACTFFAAAAILAC